MNSTRSVDTCSSGGFQIPKFQSVFVTTSSASMDLDKLQSQKVVPDYWKLGGLGRIANDSRLLWHLAVLPLLLHPWNLYVFDTSTNPNPEPLRSFKHATSTRYRLIVFLSCRHME